MGSTTLPLHRRVALAHAAVDFVARDQGIRIIHFKGPFAAGHFPARPAGMGDVDVLVDPSRALDLAAALCDRGWGSDSPVAYPTASHAVVLTEDNVFHCTFDLHIRYPGIKISDQEAFELLWCHTTINRLAQRDLRTLTVPAHAQLLLLEAARNYADRPARNAKKIQGTICGIDEGEWETFWSLSRALGSAGILRTVVPRDAPAPDDAQASLAWKLRVRERGGLAIWWARISDATTLRRKLQIFFTALLPPQPHGVERPNGMDVRAVFSRWMRGIRQVTRAVGLLQPRKNSGAPVVSGSDSADPGSFVIRSHLGSSSCGTETALDDVREATDDVSPGLPDLSATDLACIALTPADSEEFDTAILPLPNKPIVLLNAPSTVFWLAHLDPSIDDPYEEVQRHFVGMPHDAMRDLRAVERNLGEAGVLKC